MPNWVCNHLTIKGENAVDVMRSVLTKNEESDYGYDFDFNKIIPMPEDLKIISGSITRTCAKLYLNAIAEDAPAYVKYAERYVKAFDKDYLLTEQEQIDKMNDALKYRDYPNNVLLFSNKADIYAYGKRVLDNVAEYGAKDWYDWSIKNWGSKWNAANTQINDLNKADIYFDTAWSPVPAVIEKLAALHPNCQFEYEFAEEQAGFYAGFMLCEDGEIARDEVFPEGSKESYDLYFSLWGGEDEYKYNAKKGTYEYIEEQEEM